MCLTMASPRPVPRGRRERPVSTRWKRSVGRGIRLRATPRWLRPAHRVGYLVEDAGIVIATVGRWAGPVRPFSAEAEAAIPARGHDMPEKLPQPSDPRPADGDGRPVPRPAPARDDASRRLRQVVEEDVTGLAFACALGPDRALERLDLAGLDARLADARGVVWAHLNAGVTPAHDWLAACPHLPEPARDVLLGTEPETRVDRIGQGIVGSLVSLNGGTDADPFRARPSALLRRPALPDHGPPPAGRGGRPPPEGNRGRARRGERRRPRRGAARRRRDRPRGRADPAGPGSQRVEDRVVAGRGAEARQGLREARRVVLRWRGQTLLPRHAVQRLAARLPPWLDDSARFELRGAVEQLEGLADELRLLDDRAVMLEGEIAGRLAEATNRNLYVLSIITTLFLPMTLVTGIFGMNVAGLPGTQDPGAFGGWCSA